MPRRRRNRWKNNQVQHYYDENVQYYYDEEEAKPKLLSMGEVIGRESRHLEFKVGQGNLYYIIEDLPQYMCAFLNSGEPGSFMIGVNNQGEVVGVNCDQAKEDDYRKEIDKKVKTIVPVIYPKDYSVDFIPIHGQGDSKKVIRVQTKIDHPPERLYSTNNCVFVRRDGSNQKLGLQQVLEWENQRHMEKIGGLKAENKKLREEVNRKEQQLQQKTDQLLGKNDEVNNLRRQLMESSGSDNNTRGAAETEIKQELSRIHEMLTEQARLQAAANTAAESTKRKNKGSRVCVIS